MLLRWNRWNELSRLEREMSALFQDRGGLAPLAKSGDATQPIAWHPTVDVLEDGERILLAVDLPGIEQKDVEIEIENNVLTLRGERKIARAKGGDGFARYERPSGSFSRSFTLPPTVDRERITAETRAGVLTIVLPKRPETQPRQIKISVAS